MRRRRRMLIVQVALLLGLTLSLRGWAEQPPARVATSARGALAAVAEDAYIYGYPLVVLDETERQTVNVPTAANVDAPINQFARVEQLPDADFKAVVRPNVDTLYTTSFLDLEREPMVLHIPDTHGRFYMMPMLDAYTNVFASPGKRTTGTKEQTIVIAGPGWKGSIPAGATKIDAPTNSVWLVGRTAINGKPDMPDVVALTRKYSLTPLSAYGHAYTPPVNHAIDPSLPRQSRKPPDVVAALDDQAYFERLAKLMQKNPPPARDREALARFAAIGLEPGRFHPSPDAASALEGSGKRAIKRIESHVAELGKEVNGWRVDTTLGEYGTRYLDRAAIALAGLGANLPQDAVYPLLLVDSKGQRLDGEHGYVLHFAPGNAPPARAFWSLTMYDSTGYPVANPINRYAVGDRDHLQKNPDGSVDIYVQNKPPGGAMNANWLPAPKESFNLALRVYWPKQSMLDGSWQPPPLTRGRALQMGKASTEKPQH